MSTLHPLQRLLLVLLLAAAAPALSAAPFEPQIGQEGKDVIWVPTPQALIEKMLDAAKVTANDYVIDLGSGDGRTVITAAKRGARALGIEYNPDMVELSKKNAAAAAKISRGLMPGLASVLLISVTTVTGCFMSSKPTNLCR